MPRWLQILLHLGVTATGAYLSYSSGTPLPLVVSSGVQVALGGIAQTYNTDGTSQSVAFQPADKKPR